MTNNNINNILLTQMVLNNLDTLFPNLTNIQPEVLLNPSIFELWEKTMQAAINLSTIHKYLKDYNETKRFNQQFHKSLRLCYVEWSKVKIQDQESIPIPQ